MGFLIGCLVFGSAAVAARVWGYFEKRRGDRESAGRLEKRNAELTVEQRVAAVPERAAALCGDAESAFELGLTEVLRLADYFCSSAAREKRLLRLDDYAAWHPMPKRPEPPLAAPGEPWQLHFEDGRDD